MQSSTARWLTKMSSNSLPLSFRACDHTHFLCSLPGVEDGPYATVNHETASNISRPSRVKRYHDSDSEVSSFAGSAGHFYSEAHVDQSTCMSTLVTCTIHTCQNLCQCLFSLESQVRVITWFTRLTHSVCCDHMVHWTNPWCLL